MAGVDTYVGELRSTRFLHAITNMNYVVMLDDSDGGFFCAAFNSLPDAQEYIACQDYRDMYSIHKEAS